MGEKKRRLRLSASCLRWYLVGCCGSETPGIGKKKNAASGWQCAIYMDIRDNSQHTSAYVLVASQHTSAYVLLASQHT